MQTNVNRSHPGCLKIAYVIGTYPLLTTTFIDREIRFLQEHGVRLQVVSVRRPLHELSSEQRQLQEQVIYLLPVAPLQLIAAHLWALFRHPLALLGTLFYLLSRPHPSLRKRLRTGLHMSAGVYAAYLLREGGWKQVHAHFVDRATTIALVVSRLLGIPYSATAHANDIYVDPVLLPEKIAGAKFVATCTGYNKSYLEQHFANGKGGEKLRRIYHGLDVEGYEPGNRPVSSKPILVSVGQLKEKKGLTYLISACRLLKDWGYHFECWISGGGPLYGELTDQIQALNLEDTVVLHGPLPHPAIIDQYRAGTIFVLPCIQSADGDRDGIPNVILEAMAMELPVISTNHSGIPEVVQDGVNGLLVPPAEIEPLAKALATLLDDPESREKFGKRGRETVMQTFAVQPNVEKLLAEFRA